MTPAAEPWPTRAEPLRDGPPPGVAEVWRLRFDLAPPADGAGLSADERARAAAFLRPPPRLEFTYTRLALRRLLGAYLGVPAAELAFAVGAAGKPRLAGNSDLRFNVAHTRGVALLAFARGADLGVDVETHGPERDLAALARRYFAPAEVAEFDALPAAVQRQAFFLGWSRKEAFVKALGIGVAFGLDRFAVSLTPGQPAALRHVADDHGALARWRLHDIDVGAEASAALVAEAAVAAVRRFEVAAEGRYLFESSSG